MCADHPFQRPAFAAPVHAADAGLPLRSAVERASRRLHLWEIGHGWCCSIIGTCLDHEDLMRLARKEKLTISADARAYDVHAYFVNEASRGGRIARSIEKILDTRYDGAIRKVARLTDLGQLSDLWNELVSAGQVAPAYWAFLSHSHVTDELKARIFGEVHMMSHLLGGSARRIVGVAAELQGRLERMEVKQAQSSRLTDAAIERRDERIRELERLLDEARKVRIEAASESDHLAAEGRELRLERLLAKRETALRSARTRARELEAELGSVSRWLARLRLVRRDSAPPPQPAPVPEVRSADLSGRHILYLGGRASSLSQIAALAKERNAILLHHDGGEEMSSHRLDELVQRCDAVLCPVTCISHTACQRAKKLCKRLRKPFVPLPSTGIGTFAGALDGIFISAEGEAAPAGVPA